MTRLLDALFGAFAIAAAAALVGLWLFALATPEDEATVQAVARVRMAVTP